MNPKTKEIEFENGSVLSLGEGNPSDLMVSYSESGEISADALESLKPSSPSVALKLLKLQQEFNDYKKQANHNIEQLQDELTKAAAGKGVSKKGMVEVTIDGTAAYVTKNAQRWMLAKAQQVEFMFNENQRLEQLLEMQTGMKRNIHYELGGEV